MAESIFTQIINGHIPAHKIYEDDKVFAFLDIHPLVEGHVLVVPKIPVDQFYELNDEDYQAVFGVVKRIATKIKDNLQPNRVCLRIEGFEVEHAHIHVYPCNSPADFYGDKDRQAKEPDHKALASMADKLKIS